MHYRRYLKLKPQILSGYGVALFLLVIVVGWAVYNLAELGRASNEILQDNYRSILAAENMVAAIERQDSSVLVVLLGNDPTAAETFTRHELTFIGWLGRAQDNITIADEVAILEQIEATYLRYLAAFDTLQSLPPAEAQPFYVETMFPIFEQVRSQAVALRDLNQEAMVEASAYAQTTAREAIFSTALLGGLACALGGIFSLILSDRIARPLKTMAVATERIAAGDYDVALAVQSHDEVGQLADKINEMSQKLKAFHALNVGQVIAAKQHSEAIIRSINDGIVVVNEASLITAVNPYAAQLFGIVPEQVIGEHLLNVVRLTAVVESVKATLECHAPTPELDELPVEIPQGDHKLIYSFTVTPVTGDEGQMLGVVIVFQDITKFQELDRLKSEFVMTASHELRTPLTGIGMSINLLREHATSKLSARERELLDTAAEDTARLRALVNDLLDLSKIESGQLTMDIAPINMVDVAKRVVATLQTQAAEKQITLATDCPDTAVLGAADGVKIAWVLTNLIGNAMRYTDAGGRIEVRVAEHGQQVYTSVKDDGVGIPYEFQSKIFDKFMQVKSERAVGGTGLGLSISREIVRAHRGTIWVESVPGEGSLFTFTVPAVASET